MIVRFVVIGGIVVHHCLNFFFLIMVSLQSQQLTKLLVIFLLFLM